MGPFTPRITDFDDSPRFRKSPHASVGDPSPRPLLAEEPQVRATKGPLFSENLNHSQVNGRIFSYSKDVELPRDKNPHDFVKELAKTADITSHFRTTLEQTSQFLYERKAQTDAILKDHEAEKEKLDSAFRELDKAKKTCGLNSTYIPLLGDTQEIAQAITHLFTFKIHYSLLRKKCKKMLLVLASPECNEALKFYKEQKRKCKDLRAIVSADEHFTKLCAIFSETTKRLESVPASLTGKAVVVVEQTASIYQELLTFIAYSNTYPEKKGTDGVIAKTVNYIWSYIITPPTSPKNVPELQDPISKLATDIEAEQAKLRQAIDASLANMPSPRKQQSKNLDDTQTDNYLAACEHESLDPAHAFRRGTILKHTLYREMRDEVNSLERIARALVTKFTQIEKMMIDVAVRNEKDPSVDVYAREVTYCETLINGLEQRIQRQFEKIKALPSSNKIHAGWYYTSRLLDKADDLRMYTQQFKKLASPSYQPYSLALNLLLDYLSPADVLNANYLTSPEALVRLYYSLRSASELPAPTGQQNRFVDTLKADVYTIVQETLAKVGPRTLLLTENELDVPHLILQKAPLDTLQDDNEYTLIPQKIELYLYKGLLRGLYYLGKNIDPEFELTLNILLNDPMYAPSVHTMLQKTPLLYQLLQDYRKHTDMEKYVPEISLMAKILPMVGAKDPNDESGIKELFTVCQAYQIKAELESISLTSITDQHRLRTNWFMGELDKFLRPLQMVYWKYFDTFNSVDCSKQVLSEPVLAKLISLSLYAQNANERTKATETLSTILKTQKVPDPVYSRCMIMGWVLVQFMQDNLNALPQNYMSLLHEFFTIYLNHSKTQNSWRALHGISFMEKAFYKFFMAAESSRHEYAQFYTAIDTHRGQDGLDSWKGMLKCYTQFTDCITKHRVKFIQGQMEYDALDVLLDAARTDYAKPVIALRPTDTTTHLGITWLCYTDMILQYVRLRHEEFTHLLLANRQFIVPPENPDDIERRVPHLHKTEILASAIEKHKMYKEQTSPDTQQAYTSARVLVERVSSLTIPYGEQLLIDSGVEQTNEKLLEAIRLYTDVRIKFQLNSIPWFPRIQ